MKNDLNASEKRLIAALDRINGFIDRMATAGPGQRRDANAEGPSPDEDFAALCEEQAEQLAELEARLAATDDRLNAAGEEIARLAAANEALASANRALIASQPESSPGEIRHALEAELDSLRSTRDAERGQVSEIVDTLDRLLGMAQEQPEVSIPAGERSGTAPAMVETPRPVAQSVDLPGDLDLGADAEVEEREAQHAADGNRG